MIGFHTEVVERHKAEVDTKTIAHQCIHDPLSWYTKSVMKVALRSEKVKENKLRHKMLIKAE